MEDIEEYNDPINLIAPDRCKEVLIKIYKEKGYIEEREQWEQIYICGFKDGIKFMQKTRINT